jgi:hypothetical protein
LKAVEDQKRAEAEKKRREEEAKRNWFRAQEEALAKEKAAREE